LLCPTKKKVDESLFSPLNFAGDSDSFEERHVERVKRAVESDAANKRSIRSQGTVLAPQLTRLSPADQELLMALVPQQLGSLQPGPVALQLDLEKLIGALKQELASSAAAEAASTSTTEAYAFKVGIIPVEDKRRDPPAKTASELTDKFGGYGLMVPKEPNQERVERPKKLKELEIQLDLAFRAANAAKKENGNSALGTTTPRPWMRRGSFSECSQIT
jgi:hypothetical protein